LLEPRVIPTKEGSLFAQQKANSQITTSSNSQIPHRPPVIPIRRGGDGISFAQQKPFPSRMLHGYFMDTSWILHENPPSLSGTFFPFRHFDTLSALNFFSG